MFDMLEARIGAVLDRLRGQTRPPPSQGGLIIREVTDPGFLLKHLQALRSAGMSRPGGNQLSSAAYEPALAELKEAAAAASAPFMPHTPTNGQLQSILSTCIESCGARLIREAPEGLARLAHAVLEDAEIFREFGPCDPLWMETKLAEGWQAMIGKPAFPDSPPHPVPLASDAQVILVGDWGTGLPGAVSVGEAIRERIEQARGREQHLIHLGDVYYSGWREEYETRFLTHWPVEREEREVLCWALNGNHDMYSGGHGYFGFLLHDPRFRGHWRGDPGHIAPASYFSIENENWQLLGLDSAYADHDLAGSQAQWVASKVGHGPRTILLSHHQPFSAYQPVGGAMTARIIQALRRERLDVWFWGHEHRCTIYGSDPVSWLGFGSCVGNGGVPQLLPDPPLSPEQQRTAGCAPLTWAYNGEERADGDAWLRFGFAVLSFDGPRLTVEYVDERGTTITCVDRDGQPASSVALA